MELTIMTPRSEDITTAGCDPQDAPPVAPRRALVIDDDPRSASHFKETLDRMGVQAQTARSVNDGVALAASEPPDLLVLTMPDHDGVSSLNLAGELSLRHGTACIFVLERVDRTSLQEVASAGAQGVLCKPVHREQLEATFRLAMEQRRGRAGSTGRHDDARARLLEGALHRIAQELARVDLPGSATEHTPPLLGLRPREQQVVRLLLQHLRVPAIAKRLGISQQTVRNHLKSVFRRTGVRSQQELLDRIALAAASQATQVVE
ncbi:MAG TPA: response regulator transcription factor [Vicinamibacterales bacterium]|jgi:DNA-binding NarL/FixJ family response regulator|nr:response regulator transcription factor [Vicinamibacterales bacterium]